MSSGATARLTPLDLVGVGAVGLRTRRLRTAPSALGIAIAIASMVAVLGLSESSRADLRATIDRLGTNLLTVSAGSSILGEASTLPETAEEMVRRVGSVDAARATMTVDPYVYRSDVVPGTETNGLSSRPMLISSTRSRARRRPAPS